MANVSELIGVTCNCPKLESTGCQELAGRGRGGGGGATGVMANVTLDGRIGGILEPPEETSNFSGITPAGIGGGGGKGGGNGGAATNCNWFLC